MTDLSRAQWRKARLSSTSRPSDGAHVISRAAFADFLSDTKAGRYDLDC
jgi:hypothetical protein